MTDTEFRELIQEAIEEYDGCSGLIGRASSFSDEGVMTTNEGLVVRMADGSEYQLTIVRSR